MRLRGEVYGSSKVTRYWFLVTGNLSNFVHRTPSIVRFTLCWL